MEALWILTVAVLGWAVYSARSRIARIEEVARGLRVELRTMHLAWDQELSKQTLLSLSFQESRLRQISTG